MLFVIILSVIRGFCFPASYEQKEIVEFYCRVTDNSNSESLFELSLSGWGNNGADEWDNGGIAVHRENVLQ